MRNLDDFYVKVMEENSTKISGSNVILTILSTFDFDKKISFLKLIKLDTQTFFKNDPNQKVRWNVMFSA